MPNTKPPIVTAKHVVKYRNEISPFLNPCQPIMTLKLSPLTTPQIIKDAWDVGAKAAKLYPEGVTTNSHDGIPACWLLTPQPNTFYDSIKMMEDIGMILCMHGEMPGVDTFTSPYAHQHAVPGVHDKIGKFLNWIHWVTNHYPRLKMVLEHITTKNEITTILELNKKGIKIAGTVTIHHMVITHEHIIKEKLKPHLFCKPIAKFEEDRQALCDLIDANHPCFFLGTDNAPHTVKNKENEECCAGVWFPSWLEYFVEKFYSEAGIPLGKIVNFTSKFGDEFYGLPTVDRQIEFVRENWKLSKIQNGLKPFLGGRIFTWKII
jgi:dihydroorotase